MPLSKLQSDILRLLASQRQPESYVAGATPLNREASRYSGDIDFFHSREESVALAAAGDVQTLEGAGYAFAGFGACRRSTQPKLPVPTAPRAWNGL